MILQLLQLLFVSLGFGVDDHTPRNNLYPRREPEPFHFNLNPVTIVLLMVGGMILFALVLFLFAPGTESSIVYNKAHLLN